MLQDCDTPEMINKCLCCNYRECINCYEFSPRGLSCGELNFKQFERLYRKGFSDLEIADILNCHRHSVYRWRTRFKFPPNVKGKNNHS